MSDRKMTEERLVEIETRADHMTADDCAALIALAAEVRRLRATIAAALDDAGDVAEQCPGDIRGVVMLLMDQRDDAEYALKRTRAEVERQRDKGRRVMDDELKLLRAMRDAASRGPYVTDGPDVLSPFGGDRRIARCVLAWEETLPEADAEEQDRRNAAWIVAATRWASLALDAHMKPSPCVSTHHMGCACHEARRDAAIAEVARERDEARAEVERLRAIVDGRTTPPTDAEIAAHDDPWIVTPDHSSGYGVRVVGASEARAVRDAVPPGRSWSWVPWCSSLGVPCAWPVTS